MATFITPVEITPGSAGAWTDADVSAHIPSGATGIIFHVENTGASARALGFRQNGSTDNRISNIIVAQHFWGTVGVDGSRIAEFYVGDTTDVNVWLVGYFEADAVFFTNAADKSTANLAVWEDVDISGDTGADTAIGAFVECVRTNGNHGLRMNGSTDNRVQDIGLHGFGTVGVDGSEIFEQQVSNAAADIFLVGYLTSGAVFNTNATDRSIATLTTWTDLAALPAGAIGGIYEGTGSNTTARECGLRENGSSEAIIWQLLHNWPLVECDASQLVEMYIESGNADIFEVGYFEAAGGSPAFANPFGLLGVGRAA